MVLRARVRPNHNYNTTEFTHQVAAQGKVATDKMGVATESDEKGQSLVL